MGDTNSKDNRRIIYFVTNNKQKADEVNSIWERVDSSHIYTIEHYKHSLHEIQDCNMDVIASEKAREAYLLLYRPVLVEHTGLLLDEYNNLPGGLTQIVWDALGADGFCNLFAKEHETKVIARTVLAYCDGKTIELFVGDTVGFIVKQPYVTQNKKGVFWDTVFRPENSEKTFAEMGQNKNTMSMRKKALDSFYDYLRSKSEIEE